MMARMYDQNMQKLYIINKNTEQLAGSEICVTKCLKVRSHCYKISYIFTMNCYVSSDVHFSGRKQYMQHVPRRPRYEK